MTQLKNACHGRWSEILRSQAPGLIPALNRAPRHGPCPFHGGHDGFRVFDDYAETGGAVCNTCGTFPTGFHLLAFMRNGSLDAAYCEVEDALSKLPLSDTSEFAVEANTPAYWDQAKMDAIEKLMDEAVPLDDPAAQPARRYLANRGLLLDTYPNALRYHPNQPYWEGNVQLLFPCLLGLVEVDDGVVSIHRTFLTPEGQKAPVSAPKKLMPSPQRGWTNGAAVRLDEPEIALAVAEGIETALAVRQGTPIPTWATVSAGGMERLVVPSSVTDLYIWADKDRSGRGQQAAQKLAKRLSATGCHVHVLMPSYAIPEGQSGIDWLDVLNMPSADQ